tara:strand:+ start:3303 stop:3485 length:183 start_codon:yes stop_codon:yes gene_type:complete
MKVNVWVEVDKLEKIYRLLKSNLITGTIGKMTYRYPSYSEGDFVRITVSYDELIMMQDHA